MSDATGEAGREARDDAGATDDDAVERHSRAVGRALGAGLGLGAAWGLFLALLFDGNTLLGAALGTLGGFVIALAAGGIVYRKLTDG